MAAAGPSKGELKVSAINLGLQYQLWDLSPTARCGVRSGRHSEGWAARIAAGLKRVER